MRPFRSPAAETVAGSWRRSRSCCIARRPASAATSSIDRAAQALVALLRHGLLSCAAGQPPPPPPPPLKREGLALTLVLPLARPAQPHLGRGTHGRRRLVDRTKLVLAAIGSPLDSRRIAAEVALAGAPHARVSSSEGILSTVNQRPAARARARLIGQYDDLTAARASTWAFPATAISPRRFTTSWLHSVGIRATRWRPAQVLDKRAASRGGLTGNTRTSGFTVGNLMNQIKQRPASACDYNATPCDQGDGLRQSRRCVLRGVRTKLRNRTPQTAKHRLRGTGDEPVYWWLRATAPRDRVAAAFRVAPRLPEVALGPPHGR